MALDNKWSAYAAAYRDWLRNATRSFLVDVECQRRDQTEDIALAVAVGGIGVLVSHEEMASYFLLAPESTKTS